MLPAPGQRNSATRTGRPGPTLIRVAGGSATWTSHTWPAPGVGNCHGYQPLAGPPASRNGRRATPGHATCRAVDPHRPDLGGGDPVRARAHPVADLHSAERPAGEGVVPGLRRPHAARRRDAVRRGRRRIAGRDPGGGPHVPAAPGGTPAPQRRGQRLSRAMTPTPSRSPCSPPSSSWTATRGGGAVDGHTLAVELRGPPPGRKTRRRRRPRSGGPHGGRPRRQPHPTTTTDDGGRPWTITGLRPVQMHASERSQTNRG